MNCRLFDEIERTDTGPMPHSETDYAYLNRSARAEAQKIRSLLEDWFSRYPNEPMAQNKFLKRFKGVGHDKAFFELYVHEILLKQGFTCQQVEPEIPGRPTHPDFLMSEEGQDFYVEATVPDLLKEKALHEMLKKEFVDKLNAIPSAYPFRVKFEGLLKNKPSLEKFKNCLPSAKVGSSIELGQDSAKIVITILSAKKETTCGRNVGIVEHEDVRGSPGAAMIRKAIDKKSSHYGDLGKPYLIAINVSNLRPLIPDRHVVDALFGDLRLVINLKTKEHSYRRDFSTAKFITPKGRPQNRRAGGIIISKNLGPWSIAQSTPVLWHNPWAAYPFPPELWQLPQQIPKEVYEKKEGKAVSELLGLPPNWPEG